jgi:hypothetical protein
LLALVTSFDEATKMPKQAEKVAYNLYWATCRKQFAVSLERSALLRCAKCRTRRVCGNFAAASMPETKLTLPGRNVSITDTFVSPTR